MKLKINWKELGKQLWNAVKPVLLGVPELLAQLLPVDLDLHLSVPFLVYRAVLSAVASA